MLNKLELTIVFENLNETKRIFFCVGFETIVPNSEIKWLAIN